MPLNVCPVTLPPPERDRSLELTRQLRVRCEANCRTSGNARRDLPWTLCLVALHVNTSASVHDMFYQAYVSDIDNNSLAAMFDRFKSYIPYGLHIFETLLARIYVEICLNPKYHLNWAR